MRGVLFRVLVGAFLALAGLILLWFLVRERSDSEALPAALEQPIAPVVLPQGFAGRLMQGAASRRFSRVEVVPLDATRAWDLLLCAGPEPWVLFADDWESRGAGAAQDRLWLAWQGPVTPLLRARLVRLLEALLASLQLGRSEVVLPAALQPPGQDLRSWIRGTGPGQVGGAR